VLSDRSEHDCTQSRTDLPAPPLKEQDQPKTDGQCYTIERFVGPEDGRLYRSGSSPPDKLALSKEGDQRENVHELPDEDVARRPPALRAESKSAA